MRRSVAWFLGVIGLATALVLVDGRQPTLVGWLSYVVVCGLCALAAWVAWRSIAAFDPPKWLAWALLVAFAVRVGLAVVFTHLLPAYGSGRDHQLAGYFFPDAYDRDRIAWEFGRSDRALWDLSPRETRVDQYGGMLVWSALHYRLLSPDAHRPLLIGVQAATASSLAVVFTWGFVSLAFGGPAAALAAWLMGLYPEAVLLGASQMREAFTVTALAIVLFGYARGRSQGWRQGLVPIVLGSLLAAVVSPPLAALGIALVAGALIWERGAVGRLPKWVWIVLPLAIVALLALTSQAWAGAGVWGANAADVLRAWVERTATYEFFVLEQGSGMVQALFGRAPVWARAPMATLYGLARPFLPAALFEPSAPLAQTVEIVRALGWYGLLPFLVYGALAAPRAAGWRSLPTYLAVLVWVLAVAASYRGGADDWDNVRYRATFLVLQAAVAGWAWAQARESVSPWLRRAGLLVLGVVLLFSQWYAGRYVGTPSLDIYWTLAAAVVYVLSFVIGAWLLDRRAKRRLTPPSPGV